jgi:hypothetical protein
MIISSYFFIVVKYQLMQLCSAVRAFSTSCHGCLDCLVVSHSSVWIHFKVYHPRYVQVIARNSSKTKMIGHMRETSMRCSIKIRRCSVLYFFPYHIFILNYPFRLVRPWASLYGCGLVASFWEWCTSHLFCLFFVLISGKV